MPRPASAANGVAGGRVPGLYKHLESEARRRDAEFTEMNAYAVESGMDGPRPSPYAARLELFEAREPVTVPWWQLTGHQARAAGIVVNLPPRDERAKTYTVTRNDRLTPV